MSISRTATSATPVPHTDFAGSLFNEINLAGADFTEASNCDIDVLNNGIRKAKFTRYEALDLLDSLGIELIDWVSLRPFRMARWRASPLTVACPSE